MDNPVVTGGWQCPRCSASNDAAMLFCANCGLSRVDAAPPESSAAPSAAHLGEGPAVPGSASAAPGAPPNAAAPSDAAAPPAPPAPPPMPWSTTPTASAPPEAPRSLPLWRRIPLGLVVVGLVAGASAGGAWLFNASRGADGEITKSGDLTAGDLRPGDCFDLKDPASEEVGEVTARPCAEAHDYEAFFGGSLPDGDYPTDEVFGAFIEDRCAPAFAPYVGTSYQESLLDIFYLVPTPAGWQTGDRSVLCAVYEPGDAPDSVARQSAALRGSNR